TIANAYPANWTANPANCSLDQSLLHRIAPAAHASHRKDYAEKDTATVPAGTVARDRNSAGALAGQLSMAPFPRSAAQYSASPESVDHFSTPPSHPEYRMEASPDSPSPQSAGQCLASSSLAALTNVSAA